MKEWSDEISMCFTTHSLTHSSSPHYSPLDAENLKSSRSKKRRVKKELEDRAFDESGVEEFVEAPPPRKRRHFVAPSSSSSTTPTTPSTSSEKLMHMDHSLLESFLLREMQMSLC